jgi:uncharacterized protein YaiL (DUF2058 family)
MQNLRDKLLKAGLVTEKQIETALTPPKKQERNQRPPQRPAPSQRALAPRVQTEEERQRAEAFALHDKELAEQRAKELAKQQEARLQSERARSLRALINEHKLQDTLGEVSFHFVRRSGKVGRLALSPAVAKLLEEGAAAVVEMPGETDPAVLPGFAAKKAWTIDPRAIFFWAGPQKPIGFEDAPPMPAEEAAPTPGGDAAAAPGEAQAPADP